MKTTKKHTGRISLWMPIIFLCPCLIYGCAAHFQTVKAPENRAIVYVYKPKKFFSDSDYAVNANGFRINTLHNGGYFVYFAKPGRIQLSAGSEITSYVTFDVEAGHTYYVMGTVRSGSAVQRPYLQLVSTETGKNEIALCKQIGNVNANVSAQ